MQAGAERETLLTVQAGAERETLLTVQAGAEVHGVAVASVAGHGARPDLHHVGRCRPQALHLGGAVLGGHGVGHALALQQSTSSTIINPLLVLHKPGKVTLIIGGLLDC